MLTCGETTLIQEFSGCRNAQIHRPNRYTSDAVSLTKMLKITSFTVEVVANNNKSVAKTKA